MEGIGSGVGFRIANREISLVALYKYDERGVWNKVRPIWLEFFKKASCFIFVVDPSYELHEAKKELETFLDEKIVSVHTPLLVLSMSPLNDRPFDENSIANTTSLLQLSEQLGLNEMKNRAWQIRQISNADPQTTCWEGIEWLVSKIRKL